MSEWVIKVLHKSQTFLLPLLSVTSVDLNDKGKQQLLSSTYGTCSVLGPAPPLPPPPALRIKLPIFLGLKINK